jgi:hypothetical protein
MLICDYNQPYISWICDYNQPYISWIIDHASFELFNSKFDSLSYSKIMKNNNFYCDLLY